MGRIIGSLVCGLIFGWGLLESGMIRPTKVLGFLDIFGLWDPSLLVVMAAALVVTSAGYALARAGGAPRFADKYFWPEDAGIDRNLVVGAVLFGTGWGLAGLCPGPALANLATLSPKLLVFVAMMVVGMKLRDWQARTSMLSAPLQAVTEDG